MSRKTAKPHLLEPSIGCSGWFWPGCGGAMLSMCFIMGAVEVAFLGLPPLLVDIKWSQICNNYDYSTQKIVAFVLLWLLHHVYLAGIWVMFLPLEGYNWRLIFVIISWHDLHIEVGCMHMSSLATEIPNTDCNPSKTSCRHIFYWLFHLELFSVVLHIHGSVILTGFDAIPSSH